MADLTPKAITDLASATSLGNTDVIPISSSATSKKLTGRAFLDSWYKQGTALVAGDDLDDFKTAGSFYSGLSTTSAAIVNTPVTTQGYRLDVIVTSNAAYPTQIAVCYNGDIYRRAYMADGWKAWEKCYFGTYDAIPIVKITDANFSGTATSDLVAALNRASLPSPPVSFILQIGSTSPVCKATLMVSLLNAQSGGATAASFYSSLNGTRYIMSGGVWAEQT